MAGESEQILPRLVEALDKVAEWRQEQEQAAQARLDEVQAERARLLADIEQLQLEIEKLGELEVKVADELELLPAEETRRTRRAVDEGIAADAETLSERDLLYLEAVKAREERVSDMVSRPEIAELVEEYEQFQNVEPTLANLPAGYRDAIRAHHATVQQRLEPVFEASGAPLEPVDADPAAVTVVASLNPPEGPPEALALILPVPFDVYEDWTERAEDLAAVLAYRVVAAVSATLTTLGVPDAAVQYADYNGMLAVQVWFGEDSPEGDVREALGSELERLTDVATELHAARLDLFTAWLDPRVVTGGDDEDEDADDDADADDDGLDGQTTLTAEA